MIITVPGRQRIHQLRWYSYLVSQSVHQARVVAAPAGLGRACRYPALVAAELASVGVRFVDPGWLLDRKR